MRQRKLFQRASVSLACVGLLLPQPVMAVQASSTPSTSQSANETFALPVIGDVELGEGGVLLGRVTTPEGVAETGIVVAVYRDGELVARSLTDAEGVFTVEGLRGGIYQISTADTTSLFRLWTPQTAPPAAKEGVLLISGEHVIRGQCCSTGACGSCDVCCGGHFGRVRRLLRNPWVIAALIGAAIAIPIATHDSDDDDSAS